MSIKVENTVKVYEVYGTETKFGDKTVVLVKSHTFRDEFVVLEVRANGFDGVKVTVSADDLNKAVQNATNI